MNLKLIYLNYKSINIVVFSKFSIQIGIITIQMSHFKNKINGN